MPKKLDKFVTFKLHDQLYAIHLTTASQFFSCEYILSIPKLDDRLAGITYHNGQLVTVLRMDKLLGLEPILSQRALLFNYHDEYYAFLVSAGQDTLTAGNIFRDHSQKIFKTYLKNKSSRIYILNPEEIFSAVKIYD
ncbi:MAG: chemotaxis protein CheW [Patescibacteria group bacterium]